MLTKTFICIMITITCICEPHIGLTHTSSKHAWLQITEAYPSRNDVLIKKYTNSPKPSLSLFASAVQALVDHNVTELQAVGKKCNSAQPLTSSDDAAYFGCLLTVSTGFGIRWQEKYSMLWMAKAKTFYLEHRLAIDEETQSINPANISSLQIPRVEMIRKWPIQKITIKKNWKNIYLHNGLVEAYINKIPLKILVDTGTTGLILSSDTVSRYGLSKELIPTGARTGSMGNTGDFISSLYRVKEFRVGPITIHNAYVSVSPGVRSAIGINVLSSLNHFEISAKNVTHTMKPRSSECSAMKFSRNTIAQAVQYPFFYLPTNFGRLGLFLDSGLHTFGPFRNASMYIVPREVSMIANKINNKVIIKNAVLDQNGKSIQSRTIVFPILVGGISTYGYAGIGDPIDPELDGAMDFNMLSKAAIYYNFAEKEMCITPLLPETPRETLILPRGRRIDQRGEHS